MLKNILVICILLLLMSSGCMSQEVEQTNGQINDHEEEAINDEKNKGTTKTNFIEVKYRDTKVDLASPAFEYLNTDKSSWIRGAWYDSSNRYMIINLEGTYYHYCGLPSNVWNSFKKADSFGNYFNQQIKGNYDCRQGFVPEN